MPSYQIKQSSTAYPLVFLMIDSSDHVSGKTGLSPTVTLSKSGGSFASPSGSVSEIANGWYKVAGNATDSGTFGPLVLHATGSGADATDCLYEVVAHDVQDAVHLGLSSLPNVASGSAGAIPTTGTGANQINVSGGRVDANVLRLNGNTFTLALDAITSGTAQSATSTTVTLENPTVFAANELKGNTITITGGTGVGQTRTITANDGVSAAQVVTVDRAWTTTPSGTILYSVTPANSPTLNSSLQVATGVLANDVITAAAFASDAGTEIAAAVAAHASVVAIKAKTDNLPPDPADASDLAGAFSTVNSTLGTIAGYIDTEVGAIKTKTDQLTFTTSNRVDATAVAVSDKTGYALSAPGMDLIPITDPGDLASQTTFPKIMVALYRRYFGKTVLHKTGVGTATIKTYADDGSTVSTTQALTDDATTQTQGTAT